MHSVANSIIEITFIIVIIIVIPICGSSTAFSAINNQDKKYSNYYDYDNRNNHNHNNSSNRGSNNSGHNSNNTSDYKSSISSKKIEKVDSSEDIEDFFSIDNIKDSAKEAPINDPLQDINKKIFKFNSQVLDKLLNKPKNKNNKNNINKYNNNGSNSNIRGNNKAINNKPNIQKYSLSKNYFYRKRNKRLAIFLNKGITNFINNLNGPSNTVNFLLQKRPDASFQAFWRLAINSTFGLGGFLDIASLFELPNRRATFEQTFVKYGGRPGPYLMLPLLGASSVRGLFADGLEILINPFFFLIDNKLFVFIIYGYGEISRNLDYYDLIFDNNNIDSYAKIRTLYLQNQSQAYSIDY